MESTFIPLTLGHGLADHEKIDAGRPGAMPQEGDVVRVPPELLDVLPEEGQGRDLVHQAVVGDASLMGMGVGVDEACRGILSLIMVGYRLFEAHLILAGIGTIKFHYLYFMMKYKSNALVLLHTKFKQQIKVIHIFLNFMFTETKQ